MGLFGRAWAWVKSVLTDEETPAERTRTDTGDITGDTFSPEPLAPPEQDLPRGWKFEGLYYGDRAPSDRKVVNRDPSDYEVATADDVIVSYTDALGIVYKTVHGANSRRGVGSLITRTILVVSPPR